MVPDDEFPDEIGSRIEPARRRPSVFISYRREDAAGYAGHLNDSLLRWLDGWRLFLDVGSIQPGWEFGQAIEHAVQHADALIALIGPRWLGTDASRILAPDDFVRVEVVAALTAGIPVIPVLVQDARLPPASQLPEELRPLLRKHAIELRDETWRQDVERLARALQQLVQDRRLREARHATPSPSARPTAALDVSQAENEPRTGDASRGATLWRAIEQRVRANPFAYGAAAAGVLVVAFIAASGLGVQGSVRRVEQRPKVDVSTPPKSDPAREPAPSPEAIDTKSGVVVGSPLPETPTSPSVSVPPAAKPTSGKSTRHPKTGEVNRRPGRSISGPAQVPTAPPAGGVTADSSRPADNCREPQRTKHVVAKIPADTTVRGDVMVQYQVDERGRVQSARVINSDRRRREAGLEQAALDSVRLWEFEALAKECAPMTLIRVIEF